MALFRYVKFEDHQLYITYRIPFLTWVRFHISFPRLLATLRGWCPFSCPLKRITRNTQWKFLTSPFTCHRSGTAFIFSPIKYRSSSKPAWEWQLLINCRCVDGHHCFLIILYSPLGTPLSRVLQKNIITKYTRIS